MIHQIVENVFTLFPLISKELTRELRAKRNMSPSILFLIKLLYQHEQLTMTEIGCKLTVPKSHATVLVEKLIQDKLAIRSYDTSDRRLINISLTDEGRRFFLEVKKTLGEEMRQRFSTLDKEKLDDILKASQLLRDTLTSLMVRSNPDNN